MKKKLSYNQVYLLEVLSKKNCMVMYDGYVTGGWGIRFNKKTIQSLEKLDLLRGGSLTAKGIEAAKVWNNEQNVKASVATGDAQRTEP